MGIVGKFFVSEDFPATTNVILFTALYFNAGWHGCQYPEHFLIPIFVYTNWTSIFSSAFLTSFFFQVSCEGKRQLDGKTKEDALGFAVL